MFLKRLFVVTVLSLLGACAGTTLQGSPAPTPARQASTPALITAADATRDRGNFGEALRIYQQVLVDDPKATAAQYGIAECLLALGRPNDARPLFDGLASTPDYRARALQGTGLALLASDQMEAAAGRLHEAVEADPSLWRSWNALGTLSDTAQQPADAAEQYGRALALNPTSAVILNNIGYSRLLAGDPDQAIVNLRKALAIFPGSETIQINLRLALASKGRYAEAARAVPRDQVSAVFNNVGYVAMQRGDYAAAETYLSRAMQDSASYNAVAARNLELLKAHKGAEAE